MSTKVQNEKLDLWLKVHENFRTKIIQMEEILHDYTISHVPFMQELLQHMINNKGKRLRPILLFLSGSFKPVNDFLLIRAAAAVELIHTASLIHDDIIDESMERRGKPSLNAKWGNSIAVLAGDFLFARAFELIALCGDFDLNKILTRAISTMCEGEIEQIKFYFDFQLTEEQYLKNIYRKTAVLMEACCGSGGRLSKLDADALRKLEGYGRNLGYAFQITDDVLDIIGDSRVTGKPVGHDLREGIVTLPVIYVLQDPVWGPYLDEAIAKRDFSSSSLDFLRDPGCLNGPVNRARKKAAFYVRAAKDCLAGFEDGPAKIFMEELADYVLQRRR